MLMEGAGIQELEKILQVRGTKKADFPQLVKSIESKMWYFKRVTIFSILYYLRLSRLLKKYYF